MVDVPVLADAKGRPALAGDRNHDGTRQLDTQQVSVKKKRLENYWQYVRRACRVVVFAVAFECVL